MYQKTFMVFLIGYYKQEPVDFEKLKTILVQSSLEHKWQIKKELTNENGR